MSAMPKPESDNVNAMIDDTIGDRGYSFIVDISKEQLSTFLSIGFTEKNYPEFIFSVVLDPRLASKVAEFVGDNWATMHQTRQETLELPRDLSTLLQSKTIKVQEVSLRGIEEFTFFHTIRYQGVDMRAQAVVFSDIEGRFPEDDGYQGKLTQHAFKVAYLH